MAFAAARTFLRSTAKGPKGLCVLATFSDWEALIPDLIREYSCDLSDQGRYRDVPVLKEALQGLDVEAVIIRDYACLYSYKAVGAALHEETGVPVIGIVGEKDRTGDFCSIALTRGRSLRPLYVTTAGYDQGVAVVGIAKMPGSRVPLILEMLDARARGLVD